MSHRRPLARRKGLRRYRKLFVVSTEGSKTEPQYFDLLNSKSAAVHIHCLGRRRGQSPERVLAAMDKYMKEVRPKRKKRRDDRDDFGAWLVIDRDQWEMDEIDQLHSWARSHPNTHLAVSYPCFEYWLLLHFEDGDRVTGPQECIDRLKKHLPGYDKGVQLQRYIYGHDQGRSRAGQKATSIAGLSRDTQRLRFDSIQACREYSE